MPSCCQQVRPVLHVSMMESQHRPALLPCCLIFLPVNAPPLCPACVFARLVKMPAAIHLHHCPTPLSWLPGWPSLQVHYEVAGPMRASKQPALCGPQLAACCFLHHHPCHLLQAGCPCLAAWLRAVLAEPPGITFVCPLRCLQYAAPTAAPPKQQLQPAAPGYCLVPHWKITLHIISCCCCLTKSLDWCPCRR
jgi:hypothetical protein